MKWSQIKLTVGCKRKGMMDLEIVLSREYFSLLGENGEELSNACNNRVRYCVRKKGAIKPEKCFPTFQKAKEYLEEIIEASKPKIKQ